MLLKWKCESSVTDKFCSRFFEILAQGFLLLVKLDIWSCFITSSLALPLLYKQLVLIRVRLWWVRSWPWQHPLKRSWAVWSSATIKMIEAKGGQYWALTGVLEPQMSLSAARCNSVRQSRLIAGWWPRASELEELCSRYARLLFLPESTHEANTLT